MRKIFLYFTTLSYSSMEHIKVIGCKKICVRVFGSWTLWLYANWVYGAFDQVLFSLSLYTAVYTRLYYKNNNLHWVRLTIMHICGESFQLFIYIYEFLINIYVCDVYRAERSLDFYVFVLRTYAYIAFIYSGEHLINFDNIKLKTRN